MSTNSCLRKRESDRLLNKLEMEIQKENRKKGEYFTASPSSKSDILKRESKKKGSMFDLTDRISPFKMTVNLEDQLDEKSKKLEIVTRERDKFECELFTLKSELATVKRTLELERQERRDLEVKALELIKSAKKKWENAEKEKINQLNQHIESQTVRITELCTSNNEMSSKLQRLETELDTANAELHKLRVFQVQHKESMTKMRELNRQSAQGVENKLEQISTRAHNQIAELRSKLEHEAAKNQELESKLSKEEDSNHCKQSRLNVALELSQNELKDCQEQLRSLKATIPARDAEIETLKNQLQEKAKQLESATSMEQLIVTLQEQNERLKMENTQLQQQLDRLQKELNETIINLQKDGTNAMEKILSDKTGLENTLKTALEKEGEQLRKISELQDLIKNLQMKIARLEAVENTNSSYSSKGTSPRRSVTFQEVDTSPHHLPEDIKVLQQQIKNLKEELAAEREATMEANRNRYKKEREEREATLDKKIAERNLKAAEEKIKRMEEEKQRLTERLNKKLEDHEEKSKKLTKELAEAKTALADATREASRNKLQADSAQRALTQANKQIEELTTSSASLRREFDATRKQLRTSQDRLDNVQSEKDRLQYRISNLSEEKRTLETNLEKLQEEINGYQINIQLLKETATVLEEQLNDYEKLTSGHDTRENTLIQEKMKLQKDLESTEAKLREMTGFMNEEKTQRIVAERTIVRLESEASDIKDERNILTSQREQYKQLSQKLSQQVADLTNKCGNLEVSLSEYKRKLEVAQAESRVVKEESTVHLTKMHELKEANELLEKELQESIDQSHELRVRISELEDVLGHMRQFYQERELKAGSTCQQQTKLIDYLQSKLEESGKKKKGVCDKIFGSKQKENLPPVNSNAMPVGYRELENQLETERAKVKALTEQLLALKAAKATSPIKHQSPEKQSSKKSPDGESVKRQLSLQRIRHNIPHRFNVSLPMRPGKCAACKENIQFGKRVTICSDCQIMTHLKCSVSAPHNCGMPGGFKKHLGEDFESIGNLSSLGGSVQTLAIDEPDIIPERDTDGKVGKIEMESWVKLPSRLKTSWDRKYLRLEGHNLCMYDQQPTPGMSPTNRFDLCEKQGFTLTETVVQPEVSGTAKSDLPFIIRVESKSPSTCWPTARLDIMALSQLDKKNWLRALRSLSNPAGSTEKYQTMVRLERNQLDINTLVEIDENVLLLGAEEGLFSFKNSQAQHLTLIRGVKKVYQLTLHPQIGIGMMIAGEDRQLVSCDLRQLKSNALAAECSRPAITTKSVLIGSESCHLYQVNDDMLCAATASHIILLRWTTNEDSGEFISIRQIETPEPCSCALFVNNNKLIVGCHKFFQIDLITFSTDDFPQEDDSSLKAIFSGVAKVGIFPVHALNVTSNPYKTEILLCYNEFGVIVDENGHRTRSKDPTWSHLPFAFAYRKPYLYIVHFSSIEVIKLDQNSYNMTSKNPERTFIELNNARYLGMGATKGIYVSGASSILEILKIEGELTSRPSSGSLTSLDTISNTDDSSSEFSFTPSLLEVLDGQGKKVHFASLYPK